MKIIEIESMEYLRSYKVGKDVYQWWVDHHNKEAIFFKNGNEVVKMPFTSIYFPLIGGC